MDGRHQSVEPKHGRPLKTNDIKEPLLGGSVSRKGDKKDSKKLIKNNSNKDE